MQALGHALVDLGVHCNCVVGLTARFLFHRLCLK